MIRPVSENDAEDICTIYNHYIEHTFITFEVVKVSIDEMKNRIRKISAQNPWLVYEQQGRVIAYAYANLWGVREAYRNTIETTIYTDQKFCARGIGTKLYKRLLDNLTESSLHSAIAVVALPNQASVLFHEKRGFEKVGQFKEVGNKFDQWIDVGYWQKIL